MASLHSLPVLCSQSNHMLSSYMVKYSKTQNWHICGDILDYCQDMLIELLGCACLVDSSSVVHSKKYWCLSRQRNVNSAIFSVV